MKYIGLDLLKGIAAFFIVGCHLRIAETLTGGYLLHFCNMFVGVFGAVSGFLLARSMQNHQRLSDVIFRRLRRFVPMYFGWSLLYVAVSLGLGLIQGDETKIARLSNLDYWSGVVFLGGASCHLWYLSALLYSTFVIVLLEAVFRLIVKSRSIAYVGWPWFVVGGGMVYVSTCFGRDHWAIYELRLLGFMLTGVGIFRTRPVCTKQVFQLLMLCLGGGGGSCILSLKMLSPHLREIGWLSFRWCFCFQA